MFNLGSNIRMVNMGNRTAMFGGGASAWTPADITTALWLDANDATTITEDVGVSQWDDKSGNNRDVVQATDADQPTYNSTTKTVGFDGTSDYLSNSDPFMYDAGASSIYFVGSVAQEISKYIISEGSSSDDDTVYAMKTRTAGVGKTLSAFIRTDAADVRSTESILVENAWDDTQNIYQWKDTGSVLSGRQNGGTETTAAYTRSGALTTDLFLVGALARATPALFVNADFNEIVITDGTEDTATRQKIEGYLAWKWDAINGDSALKGALPADHPYKTDGSLFGYTDLDATAFTFTVKTDNTGTSNNDQMTIPLDGASSYSFYVMYDGSTVYHDANTDLTLTFPSGAGTYECKIIGTFPRIYFNNGGDKAKLTGITQFGDVSWGTSFDGAFRGTAITSVPSIPSNAVNLKNAFLGCTSLTAIPSIPSLVTNLQGSFDGCTAATGSTPVIPSGVVTMTNTFRSCAALDGTIGSVSAADGTLLTVAGTFQNCSSLTGNSEDFWNWTTPPTTTAGCYTGATSLTDYATIPAAYGGGGA